MTRQQATYRTHSQQTAASPCALVRGFCFVFSNLPDSENALSQMYVFSPTKNVALQTNGFSPECVHPLVQSQLIGNIRCKCTASRPRASACVSSKD
jgi:hypothetical protein